MSDVAREIDRPPQADDISDLDLDLLCAVARIHQAGDARTDPYGLIGDRLRTCDAPRLLSHVSAEAKAWARGQGYAEALGLDP